MFDMIYSQVRRYRKRYRTSDPFELLDLLGVVVVFSGEYSRDGLRGYCVIINRIKYVVINRNLPEEEQRVVAAHELAHLILHKARLTARAMPDFDVCNVTGRLEQEANFFAADFLIDDADVLDLVQAHGADFFAVAKELLVPAPFLAFKLYSMVRRGYNMRLPVDLDSTFLKGDR